MVESPLDGLIDTKLKRILLLFLKNKSEFYHLNKISKDSKVPLTTTLAITNKLLKLNIITLIKVGKFKVYRLSENKKTNALKGMIR